MKKLLAVVLILAITATLFFTLSITASAEIYSGKCGDNLTWSLDTNTGALTISGTGDMYDYRKNSGYSHSYTVAFDISSGRISVIVPPKFRSSNVTTAPWGKYAANLKTVELSNGVTSIGPEAFLNCENLNSITIPDSITHIGYDAFYGTGYYNNDLNWVNNILYVGNHLIEAKNTISGKCEITEGTKVIAAEAFYGCTALTSITIPKNAKSIGHLAFMGCTSLTSVEIGNGVTSIGNYAFSSCKSLTSVTIPDSVTSIGDDAFYNCSKLTHTYYSGTKEQWDKITIGNGNENLLHSFIHYNDSYTPPYAPSEDFNFINGAIIKYNGSDHAVNIPPEINGKAVTAILDGAFANSYVYHVIIPDSVTTIGTAFKECSSLRSIKLSNNLNEIANSEFESCHLLTSIDIPDSVTSIGSDAFYYCTSLTSIDIPDSVTSIGNGAFYNCENLTSVTIPDSVKSIGSYTFYNCYSLTSVNIPDSVTSIGRDAFYNCRSLTSIDIPDSVTSIGYYAFYNCESLTSVTIGNGVTSIESYAFHCCKSLESVTLPKNLKIIYGNAFSECNSLTDIYYGGSESDWKKVNISPEGNTLLSYVNIHYTQDYYTIKYDLCGGTGNIQPQHYDKNKSATVTDVIPKKENAVFLGWSSKGGAASVEYKSGAVYSKKESVTLYAVWKAVPHTTVTITPRTKFNLVDVKLFDLPNGCTVILSAYAGGKLTDIQTDVYNGETVSFIEQNNYDKIKITVWDNLSSMKPLCDIKEYTK